MEKIIRTAAEVTGGHPELLRQFDTLPPEVRQQLLASRVTLSSPEELELICRKLGRLGLPGTV